MSYFYCMKEKNDNELTSGPYLCPNCETYLKSTDAYCPNCGQKRMSHHDYSFRHMIQESFLDYFHLDSTFSRSLKPLLFNPGYLTNEYLSGRRAKYVQPFKMFLVVSLIYFLVLPLEMPKLLESKEVKKEPIPTVQENPNRITKGEPNEINLSMRDEDLNLEPTDTVKKFVEQFGMNVYIRYKYPDANFLERYLIKKALRIKLSETPFSEVIRHNASKLIFLLIPVAAFLFRLLYLKRRKLYFDHLIFSLHFHTALFLLFIFLLLLEILFTIPFYLVPLVVMVYLFMAMKRVYKQSFGKTLLKLLLFLIMYVIVALPLFFILLTTVSVAAY